MTSRRIVYLRMRDTINSGPLKDTHCRTFGRLYRASSYYARGSEAARVIDRSADKFYTHLISSVQYSAKLAVFTSMHPPGVTVDIGAV